MENFGLGLVLNFQDNATSKIDAVIGMMENLQKSIDQVVNSASGSIQSITGMSNALLTLGAGVTALGGAGVASIGSFVKSVQTMGSEFEQNITALTQLYGNATVAQQKFLAFEQMSAATPLGMQAIQSAATRLKTVGIEAEKTFNVMVDGQKKARPILEIFGDLAAIRPDKGLDTVIREAIEFIEGNARPLKMSFGLDPKSKDSIGEKLADTAEGRADQLVRIIEKAGYTGMLDKTNDQWNTIMQNLGDNFNLLMYYVSIGSGLFEEIKKPFKDLFELLRGIVGEQDDMKIIGGAIANGLRVVIAPVMALIYGFNRLVALLAQFTKEHPKIVSMGIAFVGIASQITLMIGVGIVALGIFMKLREAFFLAQAGLVVLKNMLGITSTSFGMLLRSILPVTIAIGFLYYAWKTNFLGLRTIVGGTLQYLADLFDIVADAMTHIDIEKGIFSLTKKHHKLAEEMGIMELLQTLATAYHYAVLFGRGMQEGFANAQQVISDINTKVDNFLQSLSGTPLEGFANDIKRVKEDFTTMFNPQTANDIQYVGKVFGELAVYAGILVGAFTVLKPVFTAMSTVFSALSSAFSFIWPFIVKLGSALMSIGRVLVMIVTGIAALLGLPVELVAAIIAAVVAVTAIVYAYREEIATFFSELWSSLSTWFSEAYGTVSTFFSEIWESVAEAISPITETVSYVIDYIITLFELGFQYVRLGFYTVRNIVAGVFVAIAGYLWDTFIYPAMQWFEGVYTVIERIFTDASTAIGAFIDSATTLIFAGLSAIAGFFSECFAWIKETFIDPIVNEFTYVYNQAVSVFGQVESFISGVFDSIQSVASRVLEWIQQRISDILSGIGDIASRLPSLPSLSELKERVGLVKEAADKEANASNNALGGIYSRPLLTWVAEAGYPEAIVPLDGSARGVALWEQAGRMLGALPDSLTSAEEVTAPIPTPAPVRTVPIPVPVSAPQPAQAPSDGGITFEAGSIQFNVTTDNFDADKAAQMIMPIIQRKLEIMRMTSRQGGVLA